MRLPLWFLFSLAFVAAVTGGWLYTLAHFIIKYW